MPEAHRDRVAGRLASIIEHALQECEIDKWSVAEVCECSTRTALRYLHCLEASGLLERVEGTGVRNGSPERYRPGYLLDDRPSLAARLVRLVAPGGTA